MIHYVDTSALVKRYVVEPGSEWVGELFASGQPLATCRVAYAEAAAALARRCREGLLTEAQRDRLIRAVEHDMTEMVVLNVSRLLLKPIPKIVAKASVRGFDAVHLASALRFARPDPSAVRFVCSDAVLSKGAAALGLTAIDPGNPDRVF